MGIKKITYISGADLGEGPGGPNPTPPRYFETKLRPEGPKKFFWRQALPRPPYLRSWMTAAPPPPPSPYLKVWVRHCIYRPVRNANLST